MPRADVPVLIVGAGPSGAMAALLLERLGIETRLLERRTGPQRAPAAHVVNARTLEICRAAGVDARALAEAAIAPEDAGFACWVTKLGGDLLGRLPFERQDDSQLAVTPTPLRNISQNRFEPILLDALERAASRVPEWQQQWESASQQGDLVLSQVRDLESGALREIASSWLIGADGAGSGVRKSLGIAMQGPDRLQSFIMIHLRAKLRGLPQVPPGMLFFVCDADTGGGVFVVHDLDSQAVYMHPFDPEQETTDAYDEARCDALVRGALADPGLDFRIEAIGSWTMTAQVAERYREGRIFLVGDAVHRFPPTGGLGLNTGVQDAHNLAWKLAAVIHGRAPASLLESFETERRAVAQQNTEQSLRNALGLIAVPQALGMQDPSQASRERVRETLASAAGRARVAEAIAAQADHFDMPGLQLGFVYEAGALVAEAGAEPAATDVRHYHPSGRPGARLPHAWLANEGSRESVLDRVPLGRFLLIAGPEGAAWLDALARLEAAPVEGLRLSHAALPALDAWLATAGIEADGALLVRPDQHVAWRARRAVADPAEALATALATTLSGGSAPIGG